MSQIFIPFSKPTISNSEIDSVVEVMRSGWLTTGLKAKEFETKFSSYLETNRTSLAVNSATSGLHLALESLGIGKGDEVITTTHTFTATAEVIRYLGATPIFVDISLDTYCLCLDQVSQAITPATKAIIPVHFAGFPVNLLGLEDICKPYNIAIIEDAAHSLPTTLNQKKIGSFDTYATVFSFYANKTITTGEGGMIVSSSEEAIARIKAMRLHGISKDAYDRFTTKKSSHIYDVIAPGFKYNLTDLAAAIGISQLTSCNEFHKKRTKIACRYYDSLKDSNLILPPSPQNISDHSWHLFIISIPGINNILRDKIIEEMSAFGIKLSLHYKPLHEMSYWRDTFKLESRKFPSSQSLFETSISLPIYPSLKLEEVDYIVEKLLQVLRVST